MIQKKKFEALVPGLKPDLLRRYEMIKGRRNGIAVVSARNSICSGCNMNLPPQLYNELQRSEELICCPNCNRIIYWDEDANGRISACPFSPMGHAVEIPATVGPGPSWSAGMVRWLVRQRNSSAIAPITLPSTVRSSWGSRTALERGTTAISIYLDSELLVRQVQGIYRVKNPDLKPLMVEIRDLAGPFQLLARSNMSRVAKTPGRQLANEAIDEALKEQ